MPTSDLHQIQNDGSCAWGLKRVPCESHKITWGEFTYWKTQSIDLHSIQHDGSCTWSLKRVPCKSHEIIWGGGTINQEELCFGMGALGSMFFVLSFLVRMSHIKIHVDMIPGYKKTTLQYYPENGLLKLLRKCSHDCTTL